MSPDDYDALFAESRDRRPFANGTEGYGWLDANCSTCIHEGPSRQGHEEQGCPLVLLALVGRTPAQWLDGPRDAEGRYGIADQYRCIEYRHENDAGPEPRPVPEPPGQLTLGPREPLEGVRMLTALTEPLPQVLAANHVTDGGE
ncbi:hypothetical protein [Streptomyces hoynatensis]|uniref:Uncharacterized protein n=1 Tax=Streptomyces hoynatensis TaxID=1141874 RepID=A0A3A9YXB2_9ACTN|nr:hypothetical protein [Streptomyces hoynatensis]RKN40762.1 hypothetical protein D7294_16860 [Streptomyces hoynatensis]